MLRIFSYIILPQDLIQDIEITPDKQKNQYLIQMLQAVQDGKFSFRLETVGKIVMKSFILES